MHGCFAGHAAGGSALDDSGASDDDHDSAGAADRNANSNSTAAAGRTATLGTDAVAFYGVGAAATPASGNGHGCADAHCVDRLQRTETPEYAEGRGDFDHHGDFRRLDAQRSGTNIGQLNAGIWTTDRA